MKCAVCGAQATAFITQIKNGKAVQVYLCENCARRREEMLYDRSRKSQGQVKDAVCPECGTRLSEFLHRGFLGCPDCYSAFGSAIAGMLPKIQGGTRHVPRSKTAGEKARLAETLKAELARAEREMRYDDAEAVRQRLKDMGAI